MYEYRHHINEGVCLYFLGALIPYVGTPFAVPRYAIDLSLYSWWSGVEKGRGRKNFFADFVFFGGATRVFNCQISNFSTPPHTPQRAARRLGSHT